MMDYGGIFPAVGEIVLKFGGIIRANRRVCCRFRLTHQHSSDEN